MSPDPKDVLLAATALENLKSNTHSTPNSTAVADVADVSSSSSSSSSSNATIFNKVISHPIISNSISYVLEKTISNSNNHLRSSNKRKLNDAMDSSNSSATSATTILSSSTVPCKRLKPSLRKQVSISHAMSTEKSLIELKHLSTLNVEIQSRKKLTMLIHFLKLGNSQLSERIDNLIQLVDLKREKLKLKPPTSSSCSPPPSPGSPSSSSDLSIQQIKSEIVSTVKKIVNVVSKVSADSLSEPARSNVREALLKLPANWATILNNESIFSINLNNNDDDDDDEEEEEDSDSDCDSDDEFNDTYENENDLKKNLNSSASNIPTIEVNNSTIFKRFRKPSITKRLIQSLIQYRKNKGYQFDKNTKKIKKWFREKIKYQIMNDSNGKILILAQESLDMINKIINFCNENLDKAESWNNNKNINNQLKLLNRLNNINKETKQDGGKKEDQPSSSSSSSHLPSSPSSS